MKPLPTPCLTLLLALAFAGPRVVAQDNAGTYTLQVQTVSPPAPQQTGYTVTGRVVCADTQHAARFAQVTLVPASAASGDYDRGRTAVGRTDLDGRFSMDNVPAGDYYATAEMTGYINDAPAVRNALSQGGDALNAISSVPRVQVTAGGGTAQISLQRGGTVGGIVQWDDGSAAGGVSVSVQPAPAAGTQTSLQTGSTLTLTRGSFQGSGTGGQTDDRGRFRLSGLAPGVYVLRASVQSPMVSTGGNGRFGRTMSLNVYAPNKMRSTEATAITLAAGEERNDINVVLGLNGLHSVSGQVSSSSTPVRSGTVLLTDQTDASLTRRGSINTDGSFAVPYVPPGTYTLRVTASAQAPAFGRNVGSDASIRFQPMQESITVTDTDLSGLSVTVTVATATQ